LPYVTCIQLYRYRTGSRGSVPVSAVRSSNPSSTCSTRPSTGTVRTGRNPVQEYLVILPHSCIFLFRLTGLGFKILKPTFVHGHFQNMVVRSVTPLILRCHAKLDWFKPPYLSSAGNVLSSLSVDRALSAQDLIVHAYACYAIAVSAVSTPTYMSSDELRRTVLKGREAYQKLIEASVVS
jgi:hypothetical protein